jgi:hypothetical protein
VVEHGGRHGILSLTRYFRPRGNIHAVPSRGQEHRRGTTSWKGVKRKVCGRTFALGHREGSIKGLVCPLVHFLRRYRFTRPHIDMLIVTIFDMWRLVKGRAW